MYATVEAISRLVDSWAPVDRPRGLPMLGFMVATALSVYVWALIGPLVWSVLRS